MKLRKIAVLSETLFADAGQEANTPLTRRCRLRDHRQPLCRAV